MSDRATAYSIPPQTVHSASGSELAVRPKVLRRPAHFHSARLVESPAPTLIPLLQPETAAKIQPVLRAWQDDGKFAITLLAIVIVVNLAVSAWLAAITPVSPPAVNAPAAPLDAAAASTVHVLDTHARDISEQ